jgi:hypothetical protein
MLRGRSRALILHYWEQILANENTSDFCRVVAEVTRVFIRQMKRDKTKAGNRY